MEAINKLTGKVQPLNRVNVDTDQIISKEFLKRVEKSGFGQYLFYHWRYKADGSENPDFELNDKKYEGASILVAGSNFGCGSSREHAPWALLDYGFKVIISSSFADIFYNNCLKNGILPISLPEEKLDYLLSVSQDEVYNLHINLEEQKVSDDKGFEASFEIDGYWKQMLINGWDEISLTLQLDDRIAEYERQAANN